MRLLFALACGLALAAQAEVFSGKVVAVFDGDTVLALRDGKPVKVRLLNIDAPEKEQAYGRQSRQSLQQLVGKRVVQVDTRAVDQYGRLLGTLSLDGVDINQEQVRRGMAWEYSFHHADRPYVVLQHEARQARVGLWAQDDAQPPWQWRKQHPAKHYGRGKAAQELPRDKPVMLYDMECGRKSRCSQMRSCEEARFYLNYCGVGSLDGDHDGEPCKALCGAAR
jgi:endonuclease YncB( thermonuclease family)